MRLDAVLLRPECDYRICQCRCVLSHSGVLVYPVWHEQPLLRAFGPYDQSVRTVRDRRYFHVRQRKIHMCCERSRGVFLLDKIVSVPHDVKI